MDEIFSAVLRGSLWANWLVLAVMVLRLLLRRAPKGIVCLLWGLVALRLLLPFSIQSPVSLMPESTAVFQETVDTALIHVSPAPETAPVPGAEMPPDSQIPAFRPWMLWLTGTALMDTCFLLSYLRVKRSVAEGVQEAGDIWICDQIPTPFILGITKPRIYLPSGLSPEHREYVLAHERCHLKWKDHWWKMLAFGLLSVYWFDPLLWAAYILACRDLEFACDERVIRSYSPADKKAYSQALLSCSDNRRPVLACPVAFGENVVVSRIRKVLNYQKPQFWIVLVSALAVLITAVGFLTVPVQTEDAAIAFTEPEETTALMEEQPVGISTGDGEGETWQTVDTLTATSVGISTGDGEGETFQYHVMLISDPARVYLAPASPQLSMDTPGKTIREVMAQEQAVAAFSAGTYFDDGSSTDAVGSVPCGLLIAGGEVLWDDLGELAPEAGFVGLTEDNILMVASTMTRDEAESLGIRDGCAAGPVLMVNGKINQPVYEANSGYRPRIAIGQQADGTLVVVCADGRNPESLGASWADMIDILESYNVVNACGLNSGSAVSLYSTQYLRPKQLNAASTLGSRQSYLPAFWVVSASAN